MELRILVVAADPTTSTTEHLEQEANVIREALVNKDLQPEFLFVDTLVRSELFATCEDFKPDIIDFTSHGSYSRKVLLEDHLHWVRNVTGDALARGLARAGDKVKCLLFNNCNISRGFRALAKVAASTVRFLYSSDAVDVSPIVAQRFFGRLDERLQFALAFEGAKTSLGHDDQFQGIAANLLTEEMLTEDEKISGSSAPYIDAGGVNEPKPLSSVEDKPDPRVYRVWYGTNRKPISGDQAGIRYGSERDDRLHLGYCDVAIPKYHTIGSEGDPWWKRFPKFRRNNRLSIQRRNPQEYDQYWDGLQTYFRALSEDDQVLLLFVHGYNVSFDQAAVRAAQLGSDLSVKGVTAFFSWPSKGQIKDYAADVAALEASEETLGNFIVEMVNRNSLKKAHLIGHSMGNRGLLRAFSKIVQSISESLSISLQQIFLAAPDVDVDLFKRLAIVYPKISLRTTMYVSGRDKALSSSGLLHSFPRAGYVPPVTVVDGVDTVHVSAIDLTFLGHGYIAEARPVLQDMHQLMESNTPPDRRFGLERMTAYPVYWCMKR